MLEEILERVLYELVDGRRDRPSAYVFMQAATVGLTGAPKVRTVVLRGGDRKSSSVWFSADVRSAKIAELRLDARIELASYDQSSRTQIRISGNADIDVSSETRLRIWQTMSEEIRRTFSGVSQSGAPLRLPPEFVKASTHEDDPLLNFCLVRVCLASLEWLDLFSEPHRRAHFRCMPGRWCGEWITP